MDAKFKLAIIAGTRPELIRLSQVIISAYNNKDIFELIFIHTGQNYDKNLYDVFLSDLKLPKPDYYLNAVTNEPFNTIGNIISKSSEVLENVKPDALLVLGDTDSCLSAIGAKRMNIPVFHMEAGNRSFDKRVPEELNRKIVDTIADINLPYSNISRERLIHEGFPPDRIVVTGSPMREVINSNYAEILNSDILSKLGLQKNEYILVSVHRAENVSNSVELQKIVSILNAVVKKFNKDLIVTLHPRTKKELINLSLMDKLNSRIKMLSPFGFHDYINLQINSFIVLSDSGTINEESEILNFKAVNLRNSHERHEAMEKGKVILSGLDPSNVLRSISYELRKNNQSKIDDYSDENISEKVLSVILSYTHYVNNRKF